jgi:hypothetical protein
VKTIDFEGLRAIWECFEKEEMRIGLFLGNKQQAWLDAFQNEAR